MLPELLKAYPPLKSPVVPCKIPNETAPKRAQRDINSSAMRDDSMSLQKKRGHTLHETIQN